MAAKDWEILRVYDMSAYILYQHAHHQNRDYMTINEIIQVLRTSSQIPPIPRKIKLENLLHTFEQQGLMDLARDNGRIIGIRIKACPFIPVAALVNDSKEQKKWFSE